MQQITRIVHHGGHSAQVRHGQSSGSHRLVLHDLARQHRAPGGWIGLLQRRGESHCSLCSKHRLPSSMLAPITWRLRLRSAISGLKPACDRCPAALRPCMRSRAAAAAGSPA